MTYRAISIGVLASFIFGAMVAQVYAAIPAIYTNENFFTTEHDAPASFTQDSFGNFSGLTISGKLFTQKKVVTDLAVRLHLFTIDQAHFYVSGQGIIQADTDTVALSIYLARIG
jgi:hypothetical protein